MMAATRAVPLFSSQAVSSSDGLVFDLDKVQIVAPRKEVPVSNHLLETKIYSKVARNSIVQARPAVVHFGGFELGKTMRQKLFLANVSNEVQRYHIIPPQTKFFNMKYTKNDRLVPGLTIDCVIEFYPDEFRYYYDCIRIHCKGDDNLIIPIHAYPVMNRTKFPEQVDFPPVTVGERCVRKLPLQSHCPVNFDFSVHIAHHHPAFRIDPLLGVIPANGVTYITVTFCPSDFTTCRCTIQVNVSQFNAKPLICELTGRSAPGLLRDLNDRNVLDPSCISPVERSRKKNTVNRHRAPRNEKPKEIEQNGLNFPLNLSNPHAVGFVLNQEPGKMRARDIRAAQLAAVDDDNTTRQMKEAIFGQAVRRKMYEERQNQLRWQVHLGEDPIPEKEKLAILEEREHACNAYKEKRGDATLEQEFTRTETVTKTMRIQRDYTQVGEEGCMFDLYKNDPWAVKYDILDRFTQAARTVVVRNRADHKLSMLRTLSRGMSKRDLSMLNASAKFMKGKGCDPVSEIDLSSSWHKMTSVTFPACKTADNKDDMAPNAFINMDTAPTTVTVKNKIPFFNLKVPDLYRLYGYTLGCLDQASSGHVPSVLARQLRSGAQDELVNVTLPPTEAKQQLSTAPTSDQISLFQPVTLTPIPPVSLLHPSPYPDMYIFNQSPGLQVYHSDLAYSEIDYDFQLCPLSGYDALTHHNREHNMQYIDREDVIKGVMQWKKLPSQGLTSLSNTSTITNVWVPRWTDGFETGLLPEEGPAILNKLLDHDTLEEDITVDVGEVRLTPEMVNAEFAHLDPAGATSDSVHGERQKLTTNELPFPYGSMLPNTNIPLSSSGPVSRYLREQELDHFLSNRYNRLGQKFNQKFNRIQITKTRKDLILN